jgi:hypothetical protein
LTTAARDGTASAQVGTEEWLCGVEQKNGTESDKANVMPIFHDHDT